MAIRKAVEVLLENDTKQKVLRVDQEPTTDERAQALTAALANNQSPQVLDLSWSYIHNTGTQILKGTLPVNQTLQQLCSRSNYLGDVGA